ncbi:hypothetical protein [Erythrobacter sp.]|uniref:hypothetical protein n=1 Tax=Erythrobacter sp. TaxID=1042 RepID=UPI00311E71DE
MKVPTYEIQRALPKEGAGQALNIQISSAAMEAPARAFAEQGKKMAEFGQKLADWGFKKAQVSAENAAAKAASDFELKLAEIETKALSDPDMAAGEKYFRSEIKNRYAQYRSTLPNSLSKGAFDKAAGRLQTRSVLSFMKQNNARVLEARKSTLDADTQFHTKTASDITLSPTMRVEAAAAARLGIADAVGDLGSEDAQAREEKLFENLTQNTLSAYMSKPGADVLGIVSSFREGRLADPIVQGASANLSDTQRAKIADDALKQANRIIKLRKDQREAASAAANADNDRKYSFIVNVNKDDPAMMAVARSLHDTLKVAGYYETPDKRNAIDKLLNADAGGSAFAEKSAATDEVEASLDNKEALDELTWYELEQNKTKVTATWYSSMVKRLQTERNEGEADGIDVFRDAFKYAEASDAEMLKSPSRQAFFRARRQLRDWIRDNPKASKRDIVKEAQSMVRAVEGEFKTKMKTFRQGELRSAYSKLPASLKAIIPAPTAGNIADVRRAVASVMAKGHRDLMLNAFNESLLKEVQMELLD